MNFKNKTPEETEKNVLNNSDLQKNTQNNKMKIALKKVENRNKSKLDKINLSKENLAKQEQKLQNEPQNESQSQPQNEQTKKVENSEVKNSEVKNSTNFKEKKDNLAQNNEPKEENQETENQETNWQKILSKNSPDLEKSQNLTNLSDENNKIPLIKLENLEKYYVVGGEKQMVIKGISLEIFAGETVAILGKSGSGKSTLLNILGLLDAATAGNYLLNGYNIKTLSGDFLATTRANTFGFIFQQFNLLPKLSVIENVIMPIRYTRDADKWAKRYETANKLLEMVEINEQANKLPKLLSGGQQQRVAIARSLVNSPKVVIGDEPTGALDSKTANQIVKQIFELNRELGVTIIIVTHDEDLAYKCGRVIRLVDGLIVDENTPLETTTN